jgi:hypothetical protein
MKQMPIIPNEPLSFIRQYVENHQVLWTYHVNMRMKSRFVPRSMILDSTISYEIIESYPDDKYLPSYLVYSRKDNIIFHILFAVDVAGKNVRVVTAYHPDPSHWEKDLKTRRKP